MLSDSDREQACEECGAPAPSWRDASKRRHRFRLCDKCLAGRGALVNNRLVPAPDHGRGFRRDPETGFVFYSSEWLSDEREDES
jgi:hypothetical protein